eukprot:441994_1
MSTKLKATKTHQALNIYLNQIKSNTNHVHHNNNAIIDFGIRFSYWKHNEKYPFCEAKYSNLKEELLQNAIYNVSLPQYSKLYDKGMKLHQKIQEIFGRNGDTNTPYAHYLCDLNDLYEIKFNTKISLNHLLSILTCTNLPALMIKMQNATKKLKTDENVKDVQKRHSEFTNLFKLLQETIIFYGNNLSLEDANVYATFDKQLAVQQFTTQCNMPLVAQLSFIQSNNNGLILELGGIQSNIRCAAPYFDIRSISELGNAGYLFFSAELQIKYVYISGMKCMLSPLSLYESITTGTLIRDQNDPIDIDSTGYAIDMLDTLVQKQKIIYINKNDIMNKIRNKELVSKFIQTNDDETFKAYASRLMKLENNGELEIREAEQFVWKPTHNELNQFVTEETDYIVSERMKSSDGSSFYCQMNVKEHKTKKYGTISLILYQLRSKQNQITITYQIYCPFLDGFYARLNNVSLKLDGNINNSKQIVFFEWSALENAVRRGNGIEWKIVIIQKGRKRMDVHKTDNKMIKKMLHQHQMRTDKINKEIKMNLQLKYMPLHQFSSDNICNVIKWWVFNDIRFKTCLEKAVQIFSESSLSGDQIMSLPLNNIARILEKEFLTFMTQKTFDIILRKIKYWKNVDDENIVDKTPEQIGYILYNYPTNKLFSRICNPNDLITGQKFIEYYKEANAWMKRVTGWNQTQIYQLQAVLFKHHCSTTTEIEDKITTILTDKLGESIANQIKNIFRQHNIETIKYKLQTGNHDLQDFSDAVMNIVDDILAEQSDVDNDDFFQHVYNSIAMCFVTNYKNMESASEYQLDLHQGWTCSNCNNYNFCNYVNSKIQLDLSICSLCGIQQKDSI